MWSTNITELDEKGTFRSLNGAANENIFIGRASKAGYFCFFKVWRDMPYDAVLDHHGNMYRVEVKGTSTKKFDFSRGGRSGKQINRSVPSRKRIIDHADCDFVVGVESSTGDCYIVPTDIITAINRSDVHLEAIEEFKEKWHLFQFREEDNQMNLTKDQVRDGLYQLPMETIQEIVKELGISVPQKDIPIKHSRKKITDPKSKAIFSIWLELAKYDR